MTIGLLVLCAVLLSVERVAYYVASRHTGLWRRLCRRVPWRPLREPVRAVNTLFYGFKVIQVALFWYWCSHFGHVLVPLPTAPLAGLLAGGALFVGGQILNFSVFLRLGNVGVFYGAQFGHAVPWVRGFPFSVLRHPQYLGVLLSIWGFFVIMRFPNPDWFYLPLLETVYYAWGACHEP